VTIKNTDTKGGAGNAITDMTKGLIFGDGVNSSNNVNVRVLGGAYASLKGCMRNNCA
jgi:hypothetical protein